MELMKYSKKNIMDIDFRRIKWKVILKYKQLQIDYLKIDDL